MNLHLPSSARPGDGSLGLLLLVRQSASNLAVTAIDEQPNLAFGGAGIHIPFTPGIRVFCVASIAAARERVANGEIDAVFTADLSRISRSLRETTDFVALCDRHNTRLILFEDLVDVAHENWRQQIANVMANFSLTTTKEGV